MQFPRFLPATCGLTLLLGSCLVAVHADDENSTPTSCTYFGAEREKFVALALAAMGKRGNHTLSETTSRVRAMISYTPPGGPSYTYGQSGQGSIDSYIWADFQKNGIAPAPLTSDWEFIRRVTLDLTGRIPALSTVLSFVADTTPNKRAKMIDQLLASSQWVDKWTMFYGDLFQNTVVKNTTGVDRFAQGRNAFYQYIHDSLANAKPYNQMATDLIGSLSANSYTDGPPNWLIGAYISNGPVQDTFDQETANVADVFLGNTYVNCLLCHSGAGHLTNVNLWGSGITRYQAWQMSSYMSHTQLSHTPVNPSNTNVYYWSIADNTKGYTNDYALNTTSGNRPARQPPAGCKSGQTCNYAAPQYIFTGDAPHSGESYRAALAREVTGDFQFARAAVNYVWAHFFGMGIVDPPDTFDPERLDPNNPPPAPWTLQPTNAALLNALATHFIQNGYDLRALMREIANSQTYQLSSAYPGTWNAAWEPYFARKYVRRLWGEEVHDAVAQSSGLIPNYSYTGFTDSGYSKFSYAMQLPDVTGPTLDGTAGAGNASNMLDYFLRVNRDDQPRKSDGSILQALSMMNNPFVEARLQYTGSAAAPLIAQNLSLSNTNLIDTLFLNILSRYPTSQEIATATASLGSASNRSQAVQDLVWSLYNKVDFIFNY